MDNCRGVYCCVAIFDGVSISNKVQNGPKWIIAGVYIVVLQFDGVSISDKVQNGPKWIIAGVCIVFDKFHHGRRGDRYLSLSLERCSSVIGTIFPSGSNFISCFVSSPFNAKLLHTNSSHLETFHSI